MQKEKVVIIGSGPAGLTAALYTARANLNPQVISGNLLGGQISLTNEVENYPGFSEGISGRDLADRMAAHCRRFGAEIRDRKIGRRSLSPFYLPIYEN